MKHFLLILFVNCFSYVLLGQDTTTTASGLKIIWKNKIKTKCPSVGSEVKVKYSGYFKDGSVFDSADKFKFKVGIKEVIPAWDEVVLLMCKKSKVRIIAPANLAYGKEGFPDPEHPLTYIIPPNETLYFEIELIDFK